MNIRPEESSPFRDFSVWMRKKQRGNCIIWPENGSIFRGNFLLQICWKKTPDITAGIFPLENTEEWNWVTKMPLPMAAEPIGWFWFCRKKNRHGPFLLRRSFPHTGFISTENWQEKWEIRMKKLIKSRLWTVFLHFRDLKWRKLS